MHCHTGGTSDCAKTEPQRIVELYLEAGYGAVVVTNHYASASKTFLGENNDKAAMDKILAGYKAMKKAGEKSGLKVWLGLEVTISVASLPTDMLLYGIDEKFCFDNAKMYNFSSKQLADAVRSFGGLVYQAHPYRVFPPTNLVSLKDIDGIESYNANPRHNCNFILAREYALANNLRQISSSDFHQEGDEGRGGIIAADNIATNGQLVNFLKFNKPRLLYADEGVNAFRLGNTSDSY